MGLGLPGDLLAGIEVWAPIPNHDGYEISNLGRVRSYFIQGGGRRKFPRLRHLPLRGHYLQIALDGRAYRVHTLVLEAFVGPRPPGPPRAHARHLNGDPLDNTATNLVWGTGHENAMDRHRHGTMVQGVNHPRATLYPDLVRRLRLEHADGEAICDLARRNGIHPETIRDAVTRRTWKQVE